MGREQLLVGAIVAAGALMPAARLAAAEPKFALTVTASASASDNPLVQTGSAREALVGEASIRPSMSFEDATSATTLSGSLIGREYSRLYRRYIYGRAQLDRSEQVSERLSYRGLLAYDRAVTGDVVDDLASAAEPSSVRNEWRAGLSADWRPNARSKLAVNADHSRASFERSQTLGDYQTHSLGLGYDVALSDTTRVGARASAMLNRPEVGPDADVLAGLATLEHRFGTIWTLLASLGAERVDVTGAAATRGAKFYANGDARLCRVGERLNLCLSGAIASQSTGVGPVRRRLSLGADGRYRLSERSTVTLALTYSGSQGGELRRLATYQARAGIDRRVSETLTVGTYGAYRRRTSGGTVDAGFVGVDLRWTPKLN